MYQSDDKVLEVLVPRDVRHGVVNNIKDQHSFRFSEIFDQDSSQSEVFDRMAKPVVSK